GRSARLRRARGRTLQDPVLGNRARGQRRGASAPLQGETQDHSQGGAGAAQAWAAGESAACVHVAYRATAGAAAAGAAAACAATAVAAAAFAVPAAAAAAGAAGAAAARRGTTCHITRWLLTGS